MDKCVLIKESEWKECSNKAYLYDRTFKELESTKKELIELQEKFNNEHPKDPVINVYFEAFLYKSEFPGYNRLNKYECIGESIVKNVQCSIHGDEITIEGKVRSIIRDIKDKVYNHFKQWTMDYVDTYIKEREEYLKNKYETRYNKLLKRVKEHNELCWFDSNKIKIE